MIVSLWVVSSHVANAGLTTVAKHQARNGQKGVVRKSGDDPAVNRSPEGRKSSGTRGTMSNGRSERRIPKTVSVEVSLVDVCPTSKEKALTENVSAHGVRVLMQRSLLPKQETVVISLKESVWSRAKVIYCQRAAENRFAIGLELAAGVESWARPY
jgi:hypothetical protein